MKRFIPVVSILTCILSTLPAYGMFRSIGWIPLAAINYFRISPVQFKCPSPILKLQTTQASSKESLKNSFFKPITVVAQFKFQQHASTVNDLLDNRCNLTIKNVRGSVTIQGWDENKVEITSIKESNDPVAMDATQVITNSNGIDVNCETHLKQAAHEAASSKEVVCVHYRIKMPFASHVAIHTRDGSITIQDINGSVVARSTSGTIKCTNCAHIDARSTTGDVSLFDVYNAAFVITDSGNAIIQGSSEDNRLFQAQAFSTRGDITVENADEIVAQSEFGIISKRENQAA